MRLKAVLEAVCQSSDVAAICIQRCLELSTLFNDKPETFELNVDNLPVTIKRFYAPADRKLLAVGVRHLCFDDDITGLTLNRV